MTIDCVVAIAGPADFLISISTASHRDPGVGT
jgi:hypothetical protein